MLQRLSPILAVIALALTILLGSASGCGGGGSGGSSGGSSGGTTGTTGTVNDAPGIVRDINSLPVVGAVVTYYNASGTSLGTSTISKTGQAGTPPAGATKFSVNVTSVKSSNVEVYYDTYQYGSLNYDGTVAGCYSPLTGGAFASSVVFTPRATGEPPSAPTGCSSVTP